jgi:hypothetical protein
MKAGEVAKRAAELVTGDRAREHGDMLQNYTNVAHVWNGILAAAGKQTRQPIDAHDVVTLMEGLKIARRYSGAYNEDDYVDSAGYAGLACEIRGRAKQTEHDIETPSIISILARP